MKIILRFLLIFAVIITTVVPSFRNVYANEFIISSNANLLMEKSTGRIITESNMNEKMPLASVTKVMTMLLVSEAIHTGQISKEDIVTVSENASAMGGSQVFLEPNEQQTVEVLLQSVAIASANDASVALAEYIAGSEQKFVDMMNQKASDLGMVNTKFLDTCGLTDEGHYSSAYDIALMSRELITKYPDIHNYVTMWQGQITHSTRRGDSVMDLWNTNKLLRSYNGLTGLKTGFTSKAGFCLSATAEREGMELIAVVLGSKTSKERNAEVASLLNYGFANYEIVKGNDINVSLGEIEVIKGEKDLINVYQKEEVNVLKQKNNTDEITTSISLMKEIEAPVYPDTKVGEISYIQNGEVVAKEDVIVKDEIAKASLFKNYYELFFSIA